MWARVLVLIVVLGVFGTRADWDISQHLATGSPYWSDGSTVPTPPPAGCNAVHLDLLSRHGARFPTDGDIDELNKLAAVLRNYSQYIPNTYPYIKAWTNPYLMSRQGFLSLTGEEELYQLGQRYNATYSPLFSEPYFPDVYVMQSTQVPRTGESASAFAQGFLQGLGSIGACNFQPVYIFSDTPAYDYLRFFENCAVYTQAMANGTIGKSQADIYTNMTYPAIAARVAQTLGVAPYWNISNKELDAMFTACAFEVAVFQNTDGWCALFNESDISAYEYVADLEAYWEMSYGSGIGYEISAVVLQSIVSTMEGVISNSSAYQDQNAYLRFAHAEDIVPFAALLGLFRNDYPLTASLTPEQIASRNWSASVISPFAANFALTLYECDGNDYRVKLTHNEVEYTFPGCSDLFCNFTEFKSLYAHALAYNVTRACALGEPLGRDESVSIVMFAVAIVVAFVVGGALVFIFALVYNRKYKKSRYTPLP